MFLILFTLILPGSPARADDSPIDIFRQSNLRRLEPRSVTPRGKHRGFDIVTHDENRPFRQLALGDLRWNHDQWSWEEWTPANDRRLYFFDLGFVHLAEDAITVNSLLSAAMTDPDLPNLRILHSNERQTSLKRLHKFRNVLGGPHPDPANSLVDHFFVLDGLVRWGAAPAEILERVVVSAEIHYAERIDYLTPGVLSLIHHLRFEPREKNRLPLFGRLTDPETGEFHFAREFGDEHVCEITFPRGGLAHLPNHARDRLILKILDRAERRGCTSLVTVLPRVYSPLLRPYYLVPWRGITSSGDLWVFQLRVRSKEFLFAWDSCEHNLLRDGRS